MRNQANASSDPGLLNRVQEMEKLVELRTRELHATQRDLQVMGEKLIDEVEKVPFLKYEWD